MNKKLKVSDEQLLLDIELTKKEVEAYERICRGFDILSGLPKNGGDKSAFYGFESSNYHQLYHECTGVLVELLEIKKERGL